jgi:hypothetical protein
MVNSSSYYYVGFVLLVFIDPKMNFTIFGVGLDAGIHVALLNRETRGFNDIACRHGYTRTPLLNANGLN